MIEGFEDALKFHLEREELRTKLYEELNEVDEQISDIIRRWKSKDEIHRQSLPPEAHRGPGGQTPQYVDNFHYGPTEKDEKDVEELLKKRKEIQERYAKIFICEGGLQ